MVNGAERSRTADLLNAIQALSQLSYSPTGTPTAFRIAQIGMAGNLAPSSEYITQSYRRQR